MSSPMEIEGSLEELIYLDILGHLYSVPWCYISQPVVSYVIMSIMSLKDYQTNITAMMNEIW